MLQIHCRKARAALYVTAGGRHQLYTDPSSIYLVEMFSAPSTVTENEWATTFSKHEIKVYIKTICNKIGSLRHSQSEFEVTTFQSGLDQHDAPHRHEAIVILTRN